MNKPIVNILAWLPALAVPVALLGLALRLLLLPFVPQIEYQMPGFPPDDYGFTTPERIHWAGFALNYLVNTSDISYLADLKFPDGTPLYNERELSHMQDVKRVTQGAFRAWYISLVLLIALGLWAWHSDNLHAYRKGLSRGGWLTIWLAAVVGTIVLVGMLMNPDVFWSFFAWFHSLFFSSGSWLFEYSDTLIRLFPIRFWQDIFLTVAFIVLAGGLALAFGLREHPASRA